MEHMWFQNGTRLSGSSATCKRVPRGECPKPSQNCGGFQRQCWRLDNETVEDLTADGLTRRQRPSMSSNAITILAMALPKTCQNVGRKSPLPKYGRQFLTDRPASVRQCVDFPATYIDNVLASALLLRSSSPQVGAAAVQIRSLREEQEVAKHEADLSKTEQDLAIVTTSPHSEPLLSCSYIWAVSSRPRSPLGLS